jgi:hypothetical protein
MKTKERVTEVLGFRTTPTFAKRIKRACLIKSANRTDLITEVLEKYLTHFEKQHNLTGE